MKPSKRFIIVYVQYNESLSLI